MVHLILVRHGQSLSNVGGFFTGQTDVPLSPLGERQAEALGAFLRHNFAVDAVYSSDLQRACATVQPFARAAGLTIRKRASLQGRAVRAVEEIAAENEGKTVLIATHAAFLRALQCVWQGIPLEEMKDVPWVPNASVTEAEMRGRDVRILRLADVSFLHGAVTSLAKGI